MAWYIQQLPNRPERLDLLNTKQKITFYDLMQRVLIILIKKNIMEFGLAGYGYSIKLVCLECSKQE